MNAYTEEYDEQTRLLQPRVGIIETQLRQPREYELLSHSKLLERHCKQFEERYKNVRRQWDNIRQGVPDVISEAKKQTRVHVKEIESETSVAKLQLVQEEHKKEVADYWSSTGDLLRKADHFISDEASKLTTLNNEFLRSCVSFRYVIIARTVCRHVLITTRNGLTDMGVTMEMKSYSKCEIE